VLFPSAGTNYCVVLYNADEDNCTLSLRVLMLAKGRKIRDLVARGIMNQGRR
jgi:hypothetical protein